MFIVPNKIKSMYPNSRYRMYWSILDKKIPTLLRPQRSKPNPKQPNNPLNNKQFHKKYNY